MMPSRVLVIVFGGIHDGGEAGVGAIGQIVAEGEIATHSIELLKGGVERTGSPADQDRKHGNDGGREQGQAKGSAVKAVALTEQAKPSNHDGEKNRRREDAAGHLAGDSGTVENGDEAAIGARSDGSQTQQQKEEGGVNGHGVMVKDAVEVVHTEEITQEINQGQKDDSKG
jgi:hypothetical protein